MSLGLDEESSGVAAVTESRSKPYGAGGSRRSGGPGVAVALWVRHEVAGRWRALVVLGVLAPKALAAFLGILGIAAVGHGLVSAVRRRRRDLAVLRAIGFRPRQAAACVAWHGTTVAVIALVIGIPFGIAAGHWTWRVVANATPLLYVAPVATLVVVLIGPATLVLANLLAALPARRAARLPTNEILRVE